MVPFTVKVATPLAFVTPDTVVIVELDGVPVSVIVLPLTGLLLASRAVTVIVEVEVPSAVSEVGLATTVEAVVDTGPAMKATVGAWATVTFWVVSLAVKVTVCAVVSVTEKVATPDAFVTFEIGVTTEAPVPVRVTVWLAIGRPGAVVVSWMVTVTSELALPFATTPDVGLAA